jgi:hypothetical protein
MRKKSACSRREAPAAGSTSIQEIWRIPPTSEVVAGAGEASFEVNSRALSPGLLPRAFSFLPSAAADPCRSNQLRAERWAWPRTRSLRRKVDQPRPQPTAGLGQPMDARRRSLDNRAPVRCAKIGSGSSVSVYVRQRIGQMSVGSITTGFTAVPESAALRSESGSAAGRRRKIRADS